MTPATAAARRARGAPPAQRGRGRRAAAARRRPATGAQLIPDAAARTAGAVGEIADSGVMVGLTRGRLWIALLAVLLAGIVALNVISLSFSSEASRLAERSQALEQRNSVLRAELAKQLSGKRVQSIAASLGLEVPEPGEIVYLSREERDPQAAARRLQAGELSGSPDLATAQTLAEGPVAP